ncbi:replication protein [Serratia sp. JSRIV004]|uniref:replication protein n=1 Tax=Serratia sp. JSRIV004 TaxID=2831895 RepID=UPI001CC02D2C|nr:replication protein [Serratia sp. JSRIV004]UAN58992.1 replication protein [Serratia sp. JSRIV004]UAN59619.1 replication protein [Serratia sp. JSRIV004]
MENQKLGYVPLYRSIKKKPWAKDVYLRTLWENLLLEAQRQPRTVNFKGNQWNLQAGQLVVTAADLGLSLCDRNGVPTSRDTVERMLAFFVKDGMISIYGEKRKGRVITILNYSEYAEKIDNLPAHKAAQFPAHSEASNGAGLKGDAAHKAAQFPAHHEQEGNNKNINNKHTSPSGDVSVRTVFDFWREAMNHPGAKLDAKRRGRIQARLKDGFSTDDLCKAIEGAKCDSWLMGGNPSKKVYDGIETVLRDAAQVERLKALAGQPVISNQSADWNNREAWERDFI